MATMLNVPTKTQQAEQRVVLHNVSWSLYEHLLAEHVDVPNPRFAYDQGALEIMILSVEHERLKQTFSSLVEMLAEGLDINIDPVGSTTFRREDLERGFEPDTSFYIANASRIAGKKRIDLTVDPPPDLVIEIDITSPSLPKFPIFLALGIPEVWRYDGETLSIFKLEGNAYAPTLDSDVLPGVNNKVLTDFVLASATKRRITWLRSIREWAHATRRGE